jgi:hypothetical protein
MMSECRTVASGPETDSLEWCVVNLEQNMEYDLERISSNVSMATQETMWSLRELKCTPDTESEGNERKYGILSKKRRH